MKRFMIVAGEASGDLHGSGVVRELKRLDPRCEIYGIGGEKMRAAGMELVFHIRELAVMGFWEILRHLPVLRSVEKTLEALLRVRKPDVLVLIDYPGFNLRFASTAKRYGVNVVYYISPQVWAWNPGRVRRMKGILSSMLVVFPFEEQIYAREGIPVRFVGHPLLEELEEPQPLKEFCARYDLDPEQPILGLFPGSRRQEIERIFPAMLGAARILHRTLGTQTTVGVASFLDPGYVRSFLRNDFPVRLIHNATYDAMKNATVALVTSGTATLETACFGTPMVVVYRTSWPTYLLGRLLVRIKNIGLVNIVAGERIVPEILQHEVRPERLAIEAAALLGDKERRGRVSERLMSIRERLGSPGASRRVAETVLAMA